MNTRQKCYYRDRQILNDLETMGVLNQMQIYLLRFAKDCKDPRKTQQRMKYLTEKAKKVQRWRSNGQYAYSLEKRNRLSDHQEDVNWIRLWYTLTQQKAGWKIHSFQYEQDFKVLRTDGLVILKNTQTGLYSVRFIEMDRSNNPFDKVPKYTQVFKDQKRLLSDRWWIKVVSKFPRILICTTNPQRKEKILEHIEKENVEKLNFDVKLLDDIRRECHV